MGVCAVSLLALLNAPYGLAYVTAPPDTFTGILYNYQDGHSYLAKMREGWRGEWLFTLPFTAEPGEGVFLFTYYLFLGHLARWIGTSIDLTYHLARVLGSALFLGVAYRFIAYFFDTARARLLTWLFFFITSGLGWVLVPGGYLAADLWVAESIPFLTLFSNAHFPLAWALMLLIFEFAILRSAPSAPPSSGTREDSRKWPSPPSRLAGEARGEGEPRDAANNLNLWLLLLFVTALAIVQPMTLLPVNVVLAGYWAWETTLSLRRLDWRSALPVLAVALFSVPWVVYAVWATNTQPLLREWNAQNITPSPPWWEAVLWGGVPLALAVVGATTRIADGQGQTLPLRWLIIGVVLLYTPIDLQRRMSLGLWMPLCVLAAIGLREGVLPRVMARWRLLVVTALTLPALFSNLVVVAASTAGVLGRKPELYLTAAESAAVDWLAAQPGRPLVAASPDIGLFLPGRSDARVIYGHPYETADAAMQKQTSLDFFAGRLAPEAFAARYPVDFVFVGPREAAANPPLELTGWQPVFVRDNVTIYGR